MLGCYANGMKFQYILLVSMLYAIGTCLAFAEIYRWVDSNGKVHFSDKPQGNQSTAIRPSGGNSSSSNADNDYRQQVEEQRRLLDAYSEKRAHQQKQDAAVARQQQEKQQKIEAMCKYYSKYLERGGGVFHRDANGNRIYLKESEIESFRAEKQAEYNRHCK